jgi:hypothetical protein
VKQWMKQRVNQAQFLNQTPFMNQT